MFILDEQQKRRAIEALIHYLNAPAGSDGKTPLDNDAVLDKNRLSLITHELRPLLMRFIAGNLALEEFKPTVDGINKRNNHWGFSGMKGQMFFNMLVNAVTDTTECRAELQAALALPNGEDIAKSRMRTFASYVRRVGEAVITGGGTRFQCPRESSVPLFLSYFWQICEPGTWPVMYTTSCKAMTSLNLWQQSGDLADDYILFTQVHEELKELFREHTHHEYNLYKVEHIFWFFQQGGSWTGSAEVEGSAEQTAPNAPEQLLPIPASTGQMTPQWLPNSYAPPIVSILPQLACPDDAIKRLATNSGISVAKAFEKSVNAAFTILGFNTKLLGQGSGREPDGLALNTEDSYAIIWDAKSRADSYSLGSHDDRAIREYITRKSRELRRQYRNIYFLIISGSFQSDFSDIIMELKMDTEIKEVCLVEAEALATIVEIYLQSPRDFSLGSDGLQRIFANPQGVITKLFVLDFFG